jgi:hypothetical protein
MDDRRYNVVFKGEIHEQATLSLVQERLATLFKADMENIRVMFSKKRTIVKKNATYEMCQKVEQGFLNAGAFVDIEEVITEAYYSEQEYPSEQEYAEPEQEPEYAGEPDYQTEPEPDYPHQPEYTTEPEIDNVPEESPVSESAPEYIAERDTEFIENPDIIESESKHTPDQEYAPDAEAEPQYVFENDSEDVADPDTIDPDPEVDFGSEYDFDSVLQPPELEDDLEDDESEEEIDEPSLGYGPPPDYEPDNDIQPLKMAETSRKKEDGPEENVDEPLVKETPIIEIEDDVESQIDLESDSAFEILEDESEFEIIGVDPDPEPDFDMDSDLGSDLGSEYEFDSVEPDEIEEIEVMEDEHEENPYAAPHADLSQAGPIDGNFVYPQKRSFKNGLAWLKSGFALFKQSKFKWVISVFLFTFISTIIGLIPFLGAILSNIFNPVFLAGFIIGAKEQDEGTGLRIGHVFAGFKNNFGQLILFGLLYFVTILLVFGLIGVVVILLIVAGGLGSMDFSNPSSLAPLANISPSLIILIILGGMFITVPIMMAYYFGPALISVNKVSIFEAVKLSFKGCLSNMLPFLLYGLACFGVLIVVIAAIGGSAFLIGMLHKEAGMIAGFVFIMIMSFTIMPIFIASTYSAYKDIFYSK